VVAHICNLSYLRNRDQEERGLRPVQAKSCDIFKKTVTSLIVPYRTTYKAERKGRGNKGFVFKYFTSHINVMLGVAIFCHEGQDWCILSGMLERERNCLLHDVVSHQINYP
jgi:hypothetical protein